VKVGDTMNFKELLSKKTTWTGIGMVGFGIYQITQGEMNTGITTIMAGFGLIFMRDAIGKKDSGRNK